MIDVSNGVPLIWSDEAKFDEAVYGRLFNHCKPSRRPLAVVNANTVDHVKEAVKLANELGCQISVRSGGHSWAAWSVREGSILIDLGGLDILSYDEESGIVIASPAVTAERLDSFISPKGRIFNGPHCPTVGLGGFLYHLLLAIANLGKVARRNWLELSRMGMGCRTCCRNGRGYGGGKTGILQQRYELRSVLVRQGMRSRIFRCCHRISSSDGTFAGGNAC